MDSTCTSWIPLKQEFILFILLTFLLSGWFILFHHYRTSWRDFLWRNWTSRYSFLHWHITTWCPDDVTHIHLHCHIIIWCSDDIMPFLAWNPHACIHISGLLICDISASSGLFRDISCGGILMHHSDLHCGYPIDCGHTLSISFYVSTVLQSCLVSIMA